MRIAHYLAIALLTLSAGTTSRATQPAAHHSAITVEMPWARALPPVSDNGAAWMSISNHAAHSDTLLSASTPIAARVEFHTHVKHGTMMMMKKIDAPTIAAGETLVMQPGGVHVMLLDLRTPLVAGTSFELNLRFEHAGEVPVTVKVLKQPAAHSAPAMSGKTHTH